MAGGKNTKIAAAVAKTMMAAGKAFSPEAITLDVTDLIKDSGKKKGPKKEKKNQRPEGGQGGNKSRYSSGVTSGASNGATDIDAFHSNSSNSGNPNDNY